MTVSSDGGGCLPVFDGDGRVVKLDVGSRRRAPRRCRSCSRPGQPLEKVLPAFTSNVARVLRLERKGRLEVGADADLVVLGEDGAVADVMARGRWHVREGRAVVKGTFE